jgi:hypothetical protein
MAIKEIKVATDGTITLVPEAEGAQPIVVTPRIKLAEFPEVGFNDGEMLVANCVGALANLAADQADQIVNLTQRMTLQETRLAGVVDLIKTATANLPGAGNAEPKIIHGAKMVTE